MNKELEEAIKRLNSKKDALNNHIRHYHEQDCETALCKQLIEEKEAIETVLEALDNSSNYALYDLAREMRRDGSQYWANRLSENINKGGTK